MSTKIYNGFKLTTSDFAEIYELAEAWRALFIEACQDKIEKHAAQRIVRLIDMPAALAHERPDGAQKMIEERSHSSPLSKVWFDISDEVRESMHKGTRAPLVDVDVRLHLFPFEGAVYGILHAEGSDFREKFFSQEQIEDFSYWNNTDRNEDVPEQEWSERDRVWDGIFDRRRHRSFLGNHGFEIKLTDGYAPVFDPERVVSFIPSHVDRCRETAGHVLGDKWYAEWIGDRDRQKMSGGELMEGIWQAQSKAKTDEGKAEIEALAARLQDILQPEITVDDIRSWPEVDFPTAPAP